MNRRRLVACLGALVLSMLGAGPSAALAVPQFVPGQSKLELLNAAGEPETRAGAHPGRLVEGFQIEEVGDPVEYIKTLSIELPAGLGGNATAVPTCPRWQIDRVLPSCPADTEVGVLHTAEGDHALFNVEPAPNQAVVFAALQAAPIIFIGYLRPSDLGITLTVDNVEELFPITGGEIELWGVPADHQEGTSIPRRALLTMPTRCDGNPLPIRLNMRTWQQPERWLSGTGDSGHPLTGCGDLRFTPNLDFALDSARADASSGARVDLNIPQNEDPDGRASSLLREASVTMPAGTTLSLGGAVGLRACSDAQLGLGTAADATCPDASRVGSVEMVSSGQGKPLTGSIYLGQEHPGDRFRLFIAASASGTAVKFVGSLRTDPKSGRLTTNLSGLPEVALERMTLRFDGGPNALLATPLRCGAAATSARLTPNSGGPAVDWTGTVSVGGTDGGPCAGPPPFAPTFSAGATSTRAGHAAAFTATVHRRDGEDLPSKLEVGFPAGMSAALGKVATCAAGAAASGACPAASRIGATVAELGPGANPAQLHGDIYLTGPYRRAPFGMAMVFRAAVGPFDLGTLVIRAALRVDAASGRVTVETDTLPTTFEGIQVRFQTLGLDIDRPGFMRNPTACAPTAVKATLRSAAGTTYSASSPFAVRGCIDLPFHPHFSLGFSGRSQLRRDGRPGLRIGARLPRGNANLRSASISFPRTLGFAAAGLREICARPQALADNCPKAARIGSASARTPLLKGAMKGTIYAVQPRGNGSPDIWADLSGEGLRVSLKGQTAVEHGRTEATFAGVPDFPLGSFALHLAGGDHGLFKLSANPCAVAGGLKAPTEIGGQNGARVSARIPVGLPAGCGKSG